MSLPWKAEWLALSRRISGLLEAGNFYLRCLTPDGRDPEHLADELLDNSQEIFQSLEAFLEAYGSSLPVQANLALKRFLERARGYFRGGSERRTGRPYSVQLRLTALASLQSELSYKLEDFQANARRLSERAFSHLQRSIVADSEVAKRWQRAFGEGELSCEQLGACHLLAHGIWAFKAGSAGERTDLIMCDRVDLVEAQRSAEVLVLTEWKRVQQEENPEVKARQAYDQARLYTGGSLAGFQLDSDRFLVLVSQGRCSPLPDREEEGVRYRCVNIAVKPESPSNAVRKTPRTRAGDRNRTTPALERAG